MAQEKSGLKVLEFLTDLNLANLKQASRALRQTFNRFLANYICMQLSIDKHCKRGRYVLVVREDQPPSLRIMTCRRAGMDMVQTVLQLRPDIKTLIVDQWIDAATANQLFESDLHGSITKLVFRKYVWYDERAQAVANFMMRNQTIEELEIVTVNDQSMRLGCVFQGLQHHFSLRHLKVAMNILGQDSVVFLLGCLDKLFLLHTLDVSYVIEVQEKSIYH